MSDTSTEISSFIQLESDIQLIYYWTIAGSAIALYDTILTFPQEVQFIWMGKFRGMTLLYVAARLSMLLSQILFPIYNFTQLWENGCSMFWKFFVFSYFIMVFSFSGILLARVYAIMHSRRFLFSCLAIIFLAHCVSNGIIITLQECNSAFPAEIAINIGNGLTLLYDAAIFGLTVYHTWTLVKLSRSLPEMSSGTSLASLILKQGVLRFLIIFFCVLQAFITDNLVRPSIKGITTVIERPVSALLVLRFFLDLREQNAHPNGTSQTKELTHCSSFKAAARKISNGIIEDLGDPEDEALFASQAPSSGRVSREVLRHTASEGERHDSSPWGNVLEFSWVARGLVNVEDIGGNKAVWGPITSWCGWRIKTFARISGWEYV